MNTAKASIRGAASTAAGKDLETMVAETGQMIDRLTRASLRVLDRIEQVVDNVDPAEMNVRDLRDLGYVLAVVSDKRQLLMEQKAQFEGTNEHTQAAIGKQLEGIAALREELMRRQGVLEQRERNTLDITQEARSADQDAVAREEPRRGDQPAQAASNGARQPVPRQRGPRSPYVPNPNGRPRRPRI